MTAQGALRGPKLDLMQALIESVRRPDAEEQFAGGDAAVLAGTSVQAARLVARREYMQSLARRDLQEVWEIEHPEGDHQLVGYRTAHTGALVTIEQEASTR